MIGNFSRKISLYWLGLCMNIGKHHGQVLKWQQGKKYQGPVSKYWIGCLKEEEYKIFQIAIA